MNVKSIIIQVVNNGWVVRPFYGYQFGCGGNATSEDAMYVYRDIADLQAQLPELLGTAEKPKL